MMLYNGRLTNANWMTDLSLVRLSTVTHAVALVEPAI